MLTQSERERTIDLLKYAALVSPFLELPPLSLSSLHILPVLHPVIVDAVLVVSLLQRSTNVCNRSHCKSRVGIADSTNNETNNPTNRSFQKRTNHRSHRRPNKSRRDLLNSRAQPGPGHSKILGFRVLRSARRQHHSGPQYSSECKLNYVTGLTGVNRGGI